MFHRLTKKQTIAVLGSIAALALAGGAYAYFTSSGTGTVTATVGSAASFTVTFGTPTGGPLYPGSGTQNIPYTVTNPSGGGAQNLTTTTTAIASSGADVTSAGAPVAGCLASWFTATNTAPASGTLAPGGTAGGSVAVTMQNVGVSQNACQGVAPDVTVSAS